MSTLYCFGEALFECKPTVTLVQIPIKHGKSPSRNYEPSLLCVVSRVQISTLSSKHIVCLSHVLFVESDSRVIVERKKATLGCISIDFIISLEIRKLQNRSYLKPLIKKTNNLITQSKGKP